MSAATPRTLARRLAPHYPVLYTGPAGLGAHEGILDLRDIAWARDAVALASRLRPAWPCMHEMSLWLGRNYAHKDGLIGMNKGGTVEVAGVRATMTKAEHSSTYNDGGTLVSLGEAIGYLLRMENGFTIYHTGDTAVTYDMLIVGDLYQPDLTILPIGDYFTMDPRQAHLVELRFFGGLTIEEAAHVLGVSPSTAKRDWRTAKAWLTRELAQDARS